MGSVFDTAISVALDLYEFGIWGVYGNAPMGKKKNRGTFDETMRLELASYLLDVNEVRILWDRTSWFSPLGDFVWSSAISEYLVVMVTSLRETRRRSKVSSVNS